MVDVNQELMTPHEAARWFRRSPSWLRQQQDLLRMGSGYAQPLFHVRLCRAFLLGKVCGLEGEPLRQLQIAALAAECGLALRELPVPPLGIHAGAEEGEEMEDAAQPDADADADADAKQEDEDGDEDEDE